MKNNVNDAYKFLQIAHTTAMCFGLPYSRRKIKHINEYEENFENIAGDHRYLLDGRLVPVWALFACLNAFVVRYNYTEGVSYVGDSFVACYGESYCFAVIELFNRNIGPSSNVACSMFCGRAHKSAGLAGTERALRFLERTRDPDDPDGGGHLSQLVRFVAPASLCLYLAFSHFYMAMVPPALVVAYWANAMGQVVVYLLVFVQYHVLERGFARLDRLLLLRLRAGTVDARRLPLSRLADAHDELCALVDRVNTAYAPELLLQWMYNIVRVIMVAFRLLEIASSLQGDDPIASHTKYLIVEHVGELFMFALHTTCTCTVGERLSAQSKRILASLIKLRLNNGFNSNMDNKKEVDIFYVRANARNVYASIGGFIVLDMSLIRCVCTVLATYILVLIQFRDQKGNSKPLYSNWN